jgi:hypothetical protein
MKNLLKLEELAQLCLAILGLYLQPLHFAWWLWPILFLSPDLGMLGYLINTNVGAVTYNLTHHKLVAVLFIIVGYLLMQPVYTFTGLLLYAHSSFDRVLGYGLKYPDNFKHTHLGWLSVNDKQPV